eukprot:3884012-Pyramimonas_sp.AAC.1
MSHHGSHDAPRCPKTAPRRLPVASSPRRLREFYVFGFFDGHPWPQGGSEMAQEGSKKGSREPQDGPKSAQERSKSAPRSPQEAIVWAPEGQR